MTGKVSEEYTGPQGLSGNFQRMNRHSLSQAQRVDATLITVEATNGIGHSRLNEVRIYE